MLCNPLSVTLASIMGVANPAEKIVLEKAIAELNGIYRVDQIGLRPVVQIQKLHEQTGVSRQKLADLVKARGYRFETIRYEGYHYRCWVAPECQHPKLELHRLLLEERQHVSVSRA